MSGVAEDWMVFEKTDEVIKGRGVDAHQAAELAMPVVVVVFEEVNLRCAGGRRGPVQNARVGDLIRQIL